MIFDPQSEPNLKSWLVRTLEPICDAEPGALADYVIALLRHSGPETEMRKELSNQLEEFLEKEGPPFIDQLFAALRSKSYLPYSAASPPPQTPTGPAVDNGIPIPLDGLLTPSIPLPDRGRKRSFDYDDRDGRPPAKSARMSNDGPFSRYSNGRSTGQWGGRPERLPRGRGNGDYADPMDSGMGMGEGMNGGINGGMGGMNGRPGQSYQPPGQKRGICRDYFHKGYCARGVLCKFSHGEDAVVPGQLLPMNGQMGGMPFGSMFQYGMPFGGGAYDPNERMDMRPQGRTNRAPILPRVQQEGGGSQMMNSATSGELPVIQDLTPRMPNEEGGEVTNGEMYEAQGAPGAGRAAHIPMDVDMGGPMPMQMQMPMHRPPRGGIRGRGRGGMFSAEVHNFRPERKRDDKTLVVEKIPADKLSLDVVNGWFKQFGTVTNVAIDTHTSKALVSFSTHDEAHAAWRSEEAVFGNRFVKVFWHRPMEGHGQLGQRLLAASAPLVAGMVGKEGSPSAPGAQSSTPTPAPHSRKPSRSSAAALAAKQQLLEKQIAEQKTLMEKLATTTGDEKKEVLARLRQLGQEIGASMGSSGASSLSTATTGSSAPPPPAPAQKIPTPVPSDQEQKERERLDKELEMHAVATAAEGGGESTEELKAKLAKLQAEAASLGLPEASSSYGSTSYRPYRARGRGTRGFHRGMMRAGPRSLKLDNRPKKLLVKDVPADSVQGVRDWYDTTGLVDSLENLRDGDIVVSFKTRGAAEQGLAKGTNIPTVGEVRISWFTGQSPDGSTGAATSGHKEAEKMEGQMYDAEVRHSPPPEEVAASGWGDDEDGMGLL
ncbi:hypothetical protein OE88DRAFT_1716054 [Heliocybe sulcata]|uniref:C3H1-type domain-containing protein n=1 Tax=Heliocybe sulcata TaxID=5364 RepID=A0A5C3NUH4_9AGAM|nr:hypothetical protein OE88DRAFT_1716054 [Heliocybe sulcata]